MKRNFSVRRNFGWAAVCVLVFLIAGCGRRAAPSTEKASTPAPARGQAPPAPPNDGQILGDIQARIQGESALQGQPIQVNVAGGVATLTGTVRNNASRELAAADSGAVDGVKTVINDLEVVRPKAVEPAAQKGRAPKPDRRLMAKSQPVPPPAQNAAPPPPPPPPPPAQQAVQIVQPPPPPPPPPVKTVTVPAGQVIPVRLTDALDSGVTATDSVFHGTLAADLIVDGMVAAPRGAAVLGRVVEAKDAAHFSGNAELSLELTKLYAPGQEVSLVTEAYTKQGAGRGKNTALKAGGGALLGGLLGALVGGGKGAIAGAAGGGGIGAGSNGLSRGQQVQIPSETLVNFNLKTPIKLTTSKTASPSGSNNAGDDNAPVLKRAAQQ